VLQGGLAAFDGDCHARIAAALAQPRRVAAQSQSFSESGHIS
jgi:hypothetical protein